jgi:5-methylthioadenosine/S-adenosylhomocysteine deaminase
VSGLLSAAHLFLPILERKIKMPQPVDLILAGGTLVTMDAQRRIIENGALAIRDSRIVMLGKSDEILSEVDATQVWNVSGQVITPGFINTHGHWAMTLFRGLADDQPLEAWLDRIWKMEQVHTSPENVVAGARLAMLEMIRGGTTCAADMYWQYPSATEAARQANFRMVNGPSFAEIKGFEGQSLSTPEDALEYIEQYCNDPLIHVCVQVHAAYTANPNMLRDVKKLAADYGLLFVTHASESRGEMAMVKEKYHQTPIEVLNSLGLLGDNTLLAHCVHLSDDEIQLLADTQTSVAHCPSSNLKLASGIARVADMLKAGVNVALGTDGPASNNDLDMLHEAQLAALVQKGVTNDPTVLPAEQVFAMMTVNGARAVGMADRIGSLEVGKLADITALDFDQNHLTPCYDLYSHLIYAANAMDVRNVIINGKPVMKDYTMLTLDEPQIKMQVRQVADKIKQG